MATEVVWLGHDNDIRLQLLSKGVALTASEMATITAITLSLGTVLISSTNQAGDPIRWLQGGYDDGEVRAEIGHEAIEPGIHQMPVIVYSPGEPEGVVWGSPDVHVWPDMEKAKVVFCTLGEVVVAGLDATVEVV